MNQNRRQFLAGAAGLAAFGRAFGHQTFGAEEKGTRLILLGTKGGPSLGKFRKNPSTLLLINGTPYLIDCGYGASRQLMEAGVPPGALRYIFITHHHSDHTLDYGAVVYNGWATGLPVKIDTYGPPGLEQMTRAFFEYLKFDIDTRIEDEGRPDLRKLVLTHEFGKAGLVLNNDDVKVTAALVRHPPINQAYAYRFDAADRSIVISGDTTYAPELADFAKGADVLVHEVMYLPGIESLQKGVPGITRLRQHLMASHTNTEDVGKIAARAQVKTLVLSHFVPGDDPSITDDMWTEGVRKHFNGRIVVGKDLMEV
jgi:ribonuclease BN (tRNA processing enzyme)